jgi:pilus assembly protein CpaC
MRTTGRIALPLFILLVAVTIPGIVFADDDSTPSVKLTVGRSAVVDVGSPIQRVSLTSAEVADAMVTSSSQLLVNGKMPGTISMFVWERGGTLKQYEIVVQRDLARLNEQMKRLFPGEPIEAQSNGKSIVLSGKVSNKDLIGKAAIVAGGYVDKPEDVVNMLKLQEGAGSNQVLLRVRFAEVSRSAMTELGVSLFTSPTGINNTLGRITTGQFSAPGFDSLSWTKASSDIGSAVTSAEGKFTFSDFLNLFLFSEKYDFGAVVKALQTKGLFQSLAEPNLVAESGKEASFLAGGEVPIPVAQGTGGNVAISITYKEFGIRLNFTPVIEGNRVHLKVKPEVSSLDFANAVVLQGFRVPALSTRRTETELELNDGQTFAIAGLLDNNMNSTMQKIPGIGDIPILGLLFKSKAAQKNQTELVVMITPQILNRTSPGVTNTLPRQPEPYLPPMPQNKTFEAPPPAFAPTRGTATAEMMNQPKQNSVPVQVQTVQPSASNAAAAVSALTPAANAPRVQPVPASQTPQTQTQSQMQPPSPVQAQPQAQSGQTLEARPATAVAPVSRPPAADEPARAAGSKSAQASKQDAKQTKAEAKAQKDADKAAKDAAVQQQRTDEINRNAAKYEKERQDKIDKEKAKLEKEKAKRDAERDKSAAAAAKKQAEADKEHQKQLDEAAAKAKDAQARYEALQKSQKQ